MRDELDELDREAFDLRDKLVSIANTAFGRSRNDVDAMKVYRQQGESVIKSIEALQEKFEQAGRAGSEYYLKMASAVKYFNNHVPGPGSSPAGSKATTTAAPSAAKTSRPVVDTSTTREDELKAAVKLVEQYTKKVSELHSKMESTTKRGGVITPSAIYNMEDAINALRSYIKLYEKATGEQFKFDLDMVDADFSRLKGVSAHNKQVNDLRRQLESVTKSYDALITRITAVQQKDGIVRPSDISRARDLADKLQTIEQSMRSLGVDIVSPDRTKDIDEVESGSNRARAIKAAAKEVSAAEKEVAKLEARLRTLRNSASAATAAGRETSSITLRIRQLSNQIEQARVRLAKARSEFDRLNGESGTVLQRMAAQLSGVSVSLASGARHAGTLFKKLTGISAVAPKVLGVFRSLVRLIQYQVLWTFIATTLQDLNRVYVYAAKADGEFNNLMNNMRTGLQNVKAAIASAFLPLINTFGPTAVNVMDRLSAAIHTVGMALAALTGQKTYTKMTAVVGDYASSVDDATSSTKELQNSLAGFDTFNLLSDTSGSSGGGGGTSATQATYKEEVIKLNLDDGSVYKTLQELGSQIGALGKNITNVLGGAWDVFAEEFDIDVGPLEFVTEKLEVLNKWLKENQPLLSEILGYTMLILGDIGEIAGMVFGNILNIVAALLGVEQGETALETLRNVLEKIHEILSENSEAISFFVTALLGIHVASSIITPVINIFGKFGRTAFSAGQKIIPLFKKGGAIYNGISAVFGKTGLLAKAGPTITGLAGKMGTLASKAVPLVANVGSKIAGLASSASGLGSTIAGLASSAAPAVSAAAPVVLAAGAGVALGLGTYRAVVGEEKFDENVGLWKNELRLLAEDPLGELGYLADGVVMTIGDALEPVSTFVTETVPNGIASGLNTAADFVTETVPNGIASGLSAAGSAVGTFVDGAKTSLGDAKDFIVENVGGGITSVWETGKTNAGLAVDYFSERISGFGEFVTSDVPGFFSNAWNTVGPAFGEVVGGFWTSVQEFGAGLIESVPQFFSDAFNAAKEKVFAVFNAIKESPVYQFVAGIGKKVGDGISWAVSQVTGGGTSRAVNAGANIRAYATGGRVNTGQLFIANERGPELIGSIGGKTTVTNQTQAYEAVFNGIRDAMREGLASGDGGNGGGDVYLEVTLDGNKVYDSVVRRNKEATRRSGRNPLLA